VTTVGVLGIGRMGGAMARALHAAGADLVLWNRSPEAADRLAAELGCRTTATPRDAAVATDVCVTMLADGAAVESVFRGSDGLLAGAHGGTVLVDCSTVPPSTILGLEAETRATGAGILDSPVSGSVALAEGGRLTLMVGGSDADLAAARSVLDELAATIFHLGPLGTGAAMKLAVNTVIFGLNQALAEALVLAEAAGVPRDRAYDVLEASAVGAPFVGYKRAAFLDPDGTPVAFALDLAAKDLRLIEDLARDVGLSLPQVRADLEVIETATRDGSGDRDFSSVAEHLRGRAGSREGASA
jgi:3-hydroxyisobutyrate dehydrogenase-like beta-hydroxyacid dehydrogenase